MKDPSKTAQVFLESLTSNSESTFDILTRLVEELETKTDPDMTEVRLVNHLYSYMENLRILESNLQSYVKESNKMNQTGTKLTNLYEKIADDNGSIYR